MDPKLLSGTLEMLALQVIARGPCYGYEIAQDVFGRSDGAVELKEGSLYPALHRMERGKLLESYWTEADGRNRKYYRITAAGRKALAAKRAEWQSFSGSINAVLGMESHGLA